MTASAAGTTDRRRKVSSADRIAMYGIERWPSDVDGHWLRQMSDARAAAIQNGLDPDLIKTAAGLGVARMLRKTDEFQSAMFEKIRILVREHEIPISEVMQEMQHRIARVRSAFDLTEDQVGRAVVVGLARYIDNGGSLEFAIRLADLMGIAEEKRCFLRLALDP